MTAACAIDIYECTKVDPDENRHRSYVHIKKTADGPIDPVVSRLFVHEWTQFALTTVKIFENSESERFEIIIERGRRFAQAILRKVMLIPAQDTHAVYTARKREPGNARWKNSTLDATSVAGVRGYPWEETGVIRPGTRSPRKAGFEFTRKH